MTAKIMAVILGAGLLLTPLGGSGMEADGEGDRTAKYVGWTPPYNQYIPGHWTPDCESVFGEGNCPLNPYQIIFGILYPMVCDDEMWHEAGPFQGIGRVDFCAIVGESKVSISIEDELIDQVFALVVCLWDEEVNLYYRLGTVEGSGAFEIPSGCATHPDDPEDTTRLLIWVLGPPDGVGGSVGEVTLSYERVGP